MRAAWDRFFFAERSATPLSVFRIAFGIHLVYYLVSIGWFLELYHGDGGMLARGAATGLAGAKWSLGSFAPSFAARYGLTLAAALCLALGLFTRVAAVAVWVLLSSWLNPLGPGTNAGDMIVRATAFLVMVAGVCGHLHRTHSLDALMFRRDARFENDRITSWTTRLLQIQIVLIYFFSGFTKAGSVDWTQGVAMHYVFGQTVWQRLDMSWAAASVIPVAAATFGSLLFELVVFPVLVWPRATRVPVLVAGVLFHVAIGLTVRILVFTELMPVLYLCFLEQEHYDRLEALW